MKLIAIIILTLTTFCSYTGYSQRSQILIDSVQLTSTKKITLINPGFEIEFPTGKRTSFAAQAGIGYGGSYPELTYSASGALVLIAPYLDLHSRYYTNRYKLERRGKNINNNSGSFLMIRGLARGKEIRSTFYRTSNVDFAIGAGYGFQKYKNHFGWSFTIAPYVYFDDKGNVGFFPFIPEINIGYVLGK